jgi:hypothetical protein
MLIQYDGVMYSFICKSISTGAQYVTLHWKSLMRYSSHIQWDSLEDCCDPGKMQSFQSPGGALEQSNKHNQIAFIDCSLFLIG